MRLGRKDQLGENAQSRADDIRNGIEDEDYFLLAWPMADAKMSASSRPRVCE